MGEFLNNSQTEVFLANWKVVLFFFYFSHGTYSMYVPEGMWMVGHMKSLIGSGVGYFIHNDGHTIPRNDVLIVSRSD